MVSPVLCLLVMQPCLSSDYKFWIIFNLLGGFGIEFGPELKFQ